MGFDFVLHYLLGSRPIFNGKSRDGFALGSLGLDRNANRVLIDVVAVRHRNVDREPNSFGNVPSHPFDLTPVMHRCYRILRRSGPLETTFMYETRAEYAGGT